MSTTSDDGTTAAGAGQIREPIDWDRREPVSFAVQIALSDAANRSPTELDPLADYVDPDALEAFFEHGSDPTDRELSFEYDERLVHVDGSGYVTVE